MRFVKIISFLFLMAPLSLQAQDAQPMSILQAFDQYVISKTVASVCLESDDALDQSYRAIFSDIYNKAATRLQTIKKDASVKEIVATLDHRIASLRDKVLIDVKKEGCDAKAYQQMINLYKYHARWNPFTNAQG